MPRGVTVHWYGPVAGVRQGEGRSVQDASARSWRNVRRHDRWSRRESTWYRARRHFGIASASAARPSAVSRYSRTRRSSPRSCATKPRVTSSSIVRETVLRSDPSRRATSDPDAGSSRPMFTSRANCASVRSLERNSFSNSRVTRLYALPRLYPGQVSVMCSRPRTRGFVEGLGRRCSCEAEPGRRGFFL